MCSLKISSNNKKLGWGNRGWLEIIFTILDVSKDQALKSTIMNSCNLNSVQVDKYIVFMLDRKLITKKIKTINSKKYMYKITLKGKKYQKIYEELIRLVSN